MGAVKINGLNSSVTLTAKDNVSAYDIEIPTGSLVGSDNTETGTDKVLNMVSCTQAEYNALTPVATTFYIIVG